MNKRNKTLLFLLFCVITISTIGIALTLGRNEETPRKPTSLKKHIQTEDPSFKDFMFDYDYQNTSLSEILEAYRTTHQLNESNLAYAYLNLDTKEYISYNETAQMFAASTYKLPLNMYWYELQNEGLYHSSSLLHYYDYCNEDSGGYVYSNYPIGSNVPLHILQYYSIVESDNVASQILFAGLGGWGAMMQNIKKYDPNHFVFTYENYTNAAYIINTLAYLYQNQNSFSKLLTNMKAANPNSYFKKYISDTAIAHKYGEFGDIHNDVGIIFTKQPYALAIYTNGNKDGETIVGEINRIIYEYHRVHE